VTEHWVGAAEFFEREPAVPLPIPLRLSELPHIPQVDALAKAWDDGYAAAQQELATQPTPIPEPVPEARRPVLEREGPSFGEYLRSLRLRAGLTNRAGFARQLGIDMSYLSRMESGDRLPARHELVEAIATGLRLSEYERRCLLTLAGHAPVLEWSPELESVAEVLADPTLTPLEREEFRSVMRMIAARWRGQ
jgi:transcriptional regulator with XRE-family HTH domain